MTIPDNYMFVTVHDECEGNDGDVKFLRAIVFTMTARVQEACEEARQVDMPWSANWARCSHHCDRKESCHPGIKQQRCCENMY